MRILDLFSGIGGFALAASLVGWPPPVAFCEIDPFCQAVLAKHWPGVPIHNDITTLTAESIHGPIDLICGGFPCQDISCAGRGRGIEHGERSGLWREMFRLIRELLPRWVLAENVGALRTRGADIVIANLEEAGYAVWPLVVGAWAVGAPHRRERVWVVAYRDSVGCQWVRGSRLLHTEWPALRHDSDGCHGQDAETMVNADSHRREASRTIKAWSCASIAASRWPAGRGEEQHPWEAPRVLRFERVMGAPAHGIPERLVRRRNRAALRAAGNAIVPQVAAQIFWAIRALEEERQR